MNKAAVIVLADTETHGDLGRVVNAMMTTKEFLEAGDDVELLFDGAGTQWAGLLADPDHKSHRLFSQVHDAISGACGFCSKAFSAEEGVRRADVPFREAYKGHPSMRRLVEERCSGTTSGRGAACPRDGAFLLVDLVLHDGRGSPFDDQARTVAVEESREALHVFGVRFNDDGDCVTKYASIQVAGEV